MKEDQKEDNENRSRDRLTASDHLVGHSDDRPRMLEIHVGATP